MNPTLRLLSWECVDYIWPVMRQRNYDALSVLHKLETLHLSRFAVDHEQLCEAVLRRNAASLKELSLITMVGFDSEEVWGPILKRSHSDQEEKEEEEEEKEEDDLDGDRQKYSENAMSVPAAQGILLSNLKTLRLGCIWGESSISAGVMEMDGYTVADDEETAAIFADEDPTQTDYDTITLNNFALLGLLRCCPALESLFLEPDRDTDINKIGQLLREYCPRFNTIPALGMVFNVL
ncbi:hypothetical protein BGZ98_007236 [Dissophora globulifera]|nr:hypothetical protein BGZ98_007236 [Dissophora globulifera]